MTRVRLFTPESGGGTELKLSEGQGVVVGRRPDPAAAADVLAPKQVERFPIASPSVSASHVLVHVDQGQVRVTDLGSRNGTWVRLPARFGIHLQGNEVELRIGDTPLVARPDEDPFPTVSWREPDEFPRAMAAAVRAWLQRSLHGVDVALVRSAPAASSALTTEPGMVRVPLPGDQTLEIRLSQTVDAGWPDRFGQLWRHIDAQVSIFRAEAAAREEGMILASQASRAAYRQVVEAGRRGARLMLLGPSGSGKELLARAYHRHSGRSGPFVAINCAQLDHRAPAELFGTKRGAFTDAVDSRGAVEAAHEGTLFLDEIGELNKDLQAMLLRFLDRGEFARAGDSAEVRRSDVRIVCATNRDLREEVRSDRFRLDLWFRLAAHVVEIAPLHQRPEDLRAYLAARPHRGARNTWEALSAEAAAVVAAHRWDSRWGGNFRELENFAARLPDATGASSIDAETCRRAIEAGAIEPLPRASRPSTPPAEGWTERAVDAARTGALSYVEDHGGPPGDWNAVKDFIENHLKPILFAHLSGASRMSNLEEARREASSLGADRATRARQLERYFDRFRKGT